ncbi:hypothetical protein Dimus_034385 [Dionaea muscipula]
MLARQVKFNTLFGSTNRLASIPCCFHSTQHAHQLLVESPQPNSPSINNSMLSYIHQNLSHKALDIFRARLRCGDHPQNIEEDAVAIALKACRGDPKAGAQVHGFAVSSGFISYLTVSNSLMNMYSKSGQFDRAIEVFMGMDDSDIVSYNTILSGLESSTDALRFACRMNSNGVVFDSFTCTTVVSFCWDDGEGFIFGCQLHSTILKSGLDCEVFVGNALITMYSKWGFVVEAERVFNKMPVKDTVSWNAILSAYNQEGDYGLEAIWALVEMMRQGIKFDHVSLTSAVSACGYARDLDTVTQIHCLCVKAGCGTRVSVCNVLISTYAKCGITEDATLVFFDMDERNVVSWTTMISIDKENAVAFFHGMRMEGVYPNDVTFMGLLHAITVEYLADEGKMIHGYCIKVNFISESNVSNSLITMYGTFESMLESEKVFEDLSLNHLKEVVTWNTLISGYVQNQLFEEALETFFAAVTAETRPNDYTFGSILSAIGAAEGISLRHGQRCHCHLLKLGFNANPIVSSALLDMYAKRGNLHESERIFGEITRRTQVAWTSLVSAYARHGDFNSVLTVLKEMEKEGERPDSITFLSMLTACGRNGMVDKGRQIFDSIMMEEPSREHYSCMVDMLGRAGRLKEAEELLDRIPGGPGLSALQSLLGACKIHGDVDVAQRIANRLTEIEPKESGSYVLMSNLFAEKGEWEKVAKVRRQMRSKGVKKTVGFSWVDVGASTDRSLCTHGFSSDDTSHPRSEEIYWMAGCLGRETKFVHKQGENEDICMDQTMQ